MIKIMCHSVFKIPPVHKSQLYNRYDRDSCFQLLINYILNETKLYNYNLKLYQEAVYLGLFFKISSAAL